MTQMFTLIEIYEEVNKYIERLKRPRIIVNTSNAKRLAKRIKEQLNAEMFPAIFPEYTNFSAYPEAYRSHIYIKLPDNSYYIRVYLYYSVSLYLKRGAKLALDKEPSDASIYVLDIG